MRGAKQMQFGEAVARALLIGVKRGDRPREAESWRCWESRAYRRSDEIATCDIPIFDILFANQVHTETVETI